MERESTTTETEGESATTNTTAATTTNAAAAGSVESARNGTRVSRANTRDHFSCGPRDTRALNGAQVADLGTDEEAEVTVGTERETKEEKVQSPPLLPSSSSSLSQGHERDSWTSQSMASSSGSPYPTIYESASWEALDGSSALPELESTFSSSCSGSSASSREDHGTSSINNRQDTCNVSIHPMQAAQHDSESSAVPTLLVPLEPVVSGLTTATTKTRLTMTDDKSDGIHTDANSGIVTIGDQDSAAGNSSQSTGSDGLYVTLKAAAQTFLQPPVDDDLSNHQQQRQKQKLRQQLLRAQAWIAKDDTGPNLRQLEDRVLTKRDNAGRFLGRRICGSDDCEKQSSSVSGGSSRSNTAAAPVANSSCPISHRRLLPTTSGSAHSMPAVQEQLIMEGWNSFAATSACHRPTRSAVTRVVVARPGAYHQAPGQVAIRRLPSRSLLHPNRDCAAGRQDANVDGTSSASSLLDLSRQHAGNFNTSNDISNHDSHDDITMMNDELSTALSVSSFSLQGYQEQQDHLPPDVMTMTLLDGNTSHAPASHIDTRHSYINDEEAARTSAVCAGGRRRTRSSQEYDDHSILPVLATSINPNPNQIHNPENNIPDQGNLGLVEARPVEVQENGNAVPADPVDEIPRRASPRRVFNSTKYPQVKTQLLWATMTCCMLVFGGIFALAVIFATGATKDASTNNKYFPSVQKMPLATERGLLIQRKLEEFLGSDIFYVSDDSSQENEKIARAINNEGDASACWKALDWLVNKDERYLNSTSENLLQRFLMAYFYHHTSEETRWISCNPAEGRESKFCSYHYVGPLGEHYDESPFNIRWFSPESECDWAGVYCNDLNQIKEISLNGYNLSGTFPTQIANLRNLTSLSLRDNMFHGKLPSELATFFNLEILRLNRNGFTGTLPKEWLALTSLVHLDIAWNQLTGTLLSNIGSLQSLEKLWIDHNHFSGSVPVELSLLTNLRQIYLGNNKFAGTIPSLAQITDLQYLDVSANMQLSGSLPSELGQLSHLFSLVLSSTSFRGTLPIELYGLYQLQDLRLDNCNFTGTLSPQVSQMVGLQNLILAGNFFEGELPTGLGKLKALINVQLQDNGFVGAVPESMCLLKGPNTLKDLIADCAAPAVSVKEDKVGKLVEAPIECPDGCCTSCCDVETKISN